MDDDANLLRRFAEEDCETSFNALVRRHLDVVYAAALRRTGGDAHRAADVAQEVFTALARQARQLSRHTVLSAWLHTATRNIAVNLMIAEQRRKSREIASVALEEAAHNDPTLRWDAVRPVLDAAIDELQEPDRAAVVLRFLECRNFAEIGVALSVSADAARMRTERALEKLRMALARRGITSTATALGALLTTHTGATAPAGLATTIGPAAFSAVAMKAGTWAAAGGFFMSIKTLVATAGLLAAIGLGIFFTRDRSLLQSGAPVALQPSPPSAAAAKSAPPPVGTAVASPLPTAATPRASPPRAEPAPSVPSLTVVNRQRRMLNNLRQLSAALDQFQQEYGRPPASLDEIVGQARYIRQLTPAANENYASVPLMPHQPLTIVAPDGVTVTFDPSNKLTTDLTVPSRQAHEAVRRVLTERFGSEFVQRVTTAAQKASEAYHAVHGRRPPTVEAALPYFANAQEGADFVEFTEAAKALGVKL